ncbi:MAG: cobalt ECF transporter T component CbiQ [Oscillospiraceae bacterium]|nr:cobalt ECF transporter T component CbiQ [Oscillospiraceae bacterium]
MASRVRELRALETLAAGRTAIHRLHPFAKMLTALVFIVLTASYGRYDFLRLAPYLFYPFVMMAVAELPYKLILTRLAAALPFCLFAGLSNVIFDRGAAFAVGGVTVSLGVLSLATILIKAYLCVMSALLLVATTPFPELMAQLRRLRVPLSIVLVFETAYRYVGVVLEEARSMTTAYKLRGGGKKALLMRHMGAFVGQLLLRGFDRARRVHAAMRCRGYSLHRPPPARHPFAPADALFTAAVCIPAAVLRFVW